ncbi:MAG TPA: hypothetical protein DCF33_00585 [Saprospirales bacterium]|nr:hypothetical protein [Saprospirales bacterium]
MRNRSIWYFALKVWLTGLLLSITLIYLIIPMSSENFWSSLYGGRLYYWQVVQWNLIWSWPFLFLLVWLVAQVIAKPWPLWQKRAVVLLAVLCLAIAYNAIMFNRDLFDTLLYMGVYWWPGLVGICLFRFPEG